MEQYYVGLDVHSQQSAFVIEDGAGQVVGCGEVPTTLAALAQSRADHHVPPGTPVALENGTVASFVARQRAALGLAPQVIDAHEGRLKAHRPTPKSDRRDAFEICEGLRGGIYRAIVHVPRPEVARRRPPARAHHLRDIARRPRLRRPQARRPVATWRPAHAVHPRTVGERGAPSACRNWEATILCCRIFGKM